MQFVVHLCQQFGVLNANFYWACFPYKFSLFAVLHVQKFHCFTIVPRFHLFSPPGEVQLCLVCQGETYIQGMQLLPHLPKLLPFLCPFFCHIWEERQLAAPPYNTLPTSVFPPCGCQHSFPLQVAQETDDDRPRRAAFVRHRCGAPVYAQ